MRLESVYTTRREGRGRKRVGRGEGGNEWERERIDRGGEGARRDRVYEREGRERGEGGRG